MNLKMTSVVFLMVAAIFPASAAWAHGETLKTIFKQTTKVKKQLHRGNFVACLTTEEGRQQRLILRSVNDVLAASMPQSSFLVTGSEVLHHCEAFEALLAPLKEDWQSIEIEIKRTFSRIVMLEADTCEIYDSYEDDLSAYGFPGTESYSLQQELLGKVNSRLDHKAAERACLKLYEDSIK